MPKFNSNQHSYHWTFGQEIPTTVPTVEANYSKLDSVEDIIRDASKWGLLEELREKLSCAHTTDQNESKRIARDIAFELAGASNRNLAVDVFLHATGIAEFGTETLRDYASRHGMSHEWFRQQVLQTCRRLNLPPPPTFQKGLPNEV